ncbi:hypothetical protein F2Q68_00029189 [Brassica cretica]|uniref:Uncharacterized protein n=1 Tax=Brassica cretica TaxID=69181 RepID=A0A8S9GHZ4_BRACR|nr:hypothetical protein F2Q68_00029189 [Brassica cretica]
MCSIKEKDLAVKEKDLAVKETVSKMSLLDSLISKKDSLSEAEEALKQKLLTEMLSPKECACVDVSVDESSMCTQVMGPLKIVIRSHECACVDVPVDESSMCTQTKEANRRPLLRLLRRNRGSKPRTTLLVLTESRPLVSSSSSGEVPKATTDDDSVGVDGVSSVLLTIFSI